jgi:regulatory protein
VRKSKPEEGHGAAVGLANPTAHALRAGGGYANASPRRAAESVVAGVPIGVVVPVVPVAPPGAVGTVVAVAPADPAALRNSGDAASVPDPEGLDFATLRRELEALQSARRPSRKLAPGANREAPPPADPYRKAMGLLVRREHSRRELTRKLGTRDAEPGQVQAALDKLAGQGYQDDARFSEMLVRTRIGAGYGPLHIRAELGMHGLAGEAISAVLREAEPDWPTLAREALRRRYGDRPARDRAESLKRAHYLQRRGFDLDSIRAATAAKPED